MTYIEKAIQTRSLVNPSQVPKKYSGRLKTCVACQCIYLVSLKKTISKNKFCSRECSNKNQVRGTWNKGKIPTEEHRRKISLSLRGEKSPLWKGGVTKENILIRSGVDYKLWREEIFKRDDWTCQMCGKKGVYLNADHIKPFAYFPDLRFELSNGRTLCRDCHKLTDTYAQRARNKYEKLN